MCTSVNIKVKQQKPETKSSFNFVCLYALLQTCSRFVLFLCYSVFSKCRKTNHTTYLSLCDSFLFPAVRYLGSLRAFVSCSTKPQSSMVIGWREKESRSLRVTSFFTKSGVWDMDHHHELNLIGAVKFVLPDY